MVILTANLYNAPRSCELILEREGHSSLLSNYHFDLMGSIHCSGIAHVAGNLNRNNAKQID